MQFVLIDAFSFASFSLAELLAASEVSSFGERFWCAVAEWITEKPQCRWS
ncbi:MAG: hypothetical protein H2048_02435 [Erythrobacter sp.]|nr:hypothetical protein [Erythrobacter sp.]